METPIQLIVGLCNPGAQYQKNRHNAGAFFLHQFAVSEGCDFLATSKFKGLHARTASGCHLLLPTTFMNHSGQAVHAIAQFYKIPSQAILIAHDELDLPVGDIKLKFNKGHGGHNGLRDIISHLGTKAFLNLRIGIGRPTQGEDVADYVLKNPLKSEQRLIDNAIKRALTVMPDVLAGHLEKATHTLHSE